MTWGLKQPHSWTAHTLADEDSDQPVVYTTAAHCIYPHWRRALRVINAFDLGFQHEGDINGMCLALEARDCRNWKQQPGERYRTCGPEVHNNFNRHTWKHLPESAHAPQSILWAKEGVTITYSIPPTVKMMMTWILNLQAQSLLLNSGKTKSWTPIDTSNSSSQFSAHC